MVGATLQMLESCVRDMGLHADSTWVHNGRVVRSKCPYLSIHRFGPSDNMTCAPWIPGGGIILCDPKLATVARGAFSSSDGMYPGLVLQLHGIAGATRCLSRDINLIHLGQGLRIFRGKHSLFLESSHWSSAPRRATSRCRASDCQWRIQTHRESRRNRKGGQPQMP